MTQESEPKIRTAFSIHATVVADLQRLVAELKAQARTASRPLPTGSSVVESALLAEIKKRRTRLDKSTGTASETE